MSYSLAWCVPHGGAGGLDAGAAWPPPHCSLESPVDLQFLQKPSKRH